MLPVHVSVGLFGIAFIGGSALVALWLDARFPGRLPTSLTRALVHVGAALLISQTLIPEALDRAHSPGPLVGAVFIVAFPVLTYLLVATLWSIRHLQRTLAGRWS